MQGENACTRAWASDEIEELYDMKLRIISISPSRYVSNEGDESRYKGKRLGQEQPHVYGIAEEAYAKLAKVRVSPAWDDAKAVAGQRLVDR